MQWLCVAGNNVQEIPAQIVSGRLWLVPSGDKAKRQGLPLSKIRPSFTQWLFSFCPPSDYCLTTIFQKPEKPWEPRRCKGFHSFCKSVLILCDVPETRSKPGFLLWWPDNSDSVESWSPAGTVHDRPSRQVRTLVRIQSGAPKPPRELLLWRFSFAYNNVEKGKVYRNRDTDLGIRENLCSSQMVVKIRNYS